MLPHPEMLYRHHELRHKELIAKAERVRLVDRALGRRSWPLDTLVSTIRLMAGLTSTKFERAAPGHEVRPQFEDGPVKSTS